MPTTKTTEPAPARRTRKAAVQVNPDGSTGRTEPEAPKPERGPRGEHLDRHGLVLEDGSVVKLSFTEFELTTHPDRAGWTVVCRLHGTSHPAATKQAAERAGARAARAGWCRRCAKKS